MRKIKPLTPQQMRKLDETTIKQYGIPGLILMENAGRGVAEKIGERLKRSKNGKNVLILSGSGNNGGDGLVVGRHLFNAGFRIRVLLIGSASKLSSDCRINYLIDKKMGVPILIAKITLCFSLRRELRKADIVVDAIFGTGLSRPIKGELAKAIALLNEASQAIISIDIPSGLNGKTGDILGVAVRASETLTLGAPKTGFFRSEGPRHTGKISVIDISIPRQLLN